MNDKKHIVPSFPTPTPDRPIPVSIANPVRLALWADDGLREQFLVERGSSLASAERELIASWKHRISGQFIVFKHLRSHSIFINKGVFGVVGIYSPLAELVHNVPAYVARSCCPLAIGSSSMDSSCRPVCSSALAQGCGECLKSNTPKRVTNRRSERRFFL